MKVTNLRSTILLLSTVSLTVDITSAGGEQFLLRGGGRAPFDSKMCLAATARFEPCDIVQGTAKWKAIVSNSEGGMDLLFVTV